MVKWLKDENKTSEQNKWLEFLPKAELEVALKKEKSKTAIDFFPKNLSSFETFSSPKKKLF